MKLLRAAVVASLCFFCLHLSQARAANDYAKTEYPIVLVHGLSGASRILGVVEYWYNITNDLRAHGATVYVADLSAFAGENLRGEELLRQVRTVLAATGASKVNLIGHSQGGLSSRYVAAVMPQAVASVTTIGTPHTGTEVADWVAESPTIVQSVLAGATSVAGSIFGLFVGDPQPQDPLGALHVLSTAGAADFNRQFPSAGVPANCQSDGAISDTRDGNTQQLYSWTGNQPFTNILDIADPLMVLGGSVIQLRGGGASDGLVSVCSARFGKTLGVYGWNHLDEVNLLFGLRGLFSADPVVTIRTHANRLKQAQL